MTLADDLRLASRNFATGFETTANAGLELFETVGGTVQNTVSSFRGAQQRVGIAPSVSGPPPSEPFTEVEIQQLQPPRPMGQGIDRRTLLIAGAGLVLLLALAG